MQRGQPRIRLAAADARLVASDEVRIRRSGAAANAEHPEGVDVPRDRGADVAPAKWTEEGPLLDVEGALPGRVEQQQDGDASRAEKDGNQADPMRLSGHGRPGLGPSRASSARINANSKQWPFRPPVRASARQ